MRGGTMSTPSRRWVAMILLASSLLAACRQRGPIFEVRRTTPVPCAGSLPGTCYGAEVENIGDRSGDGVCRAARQDTLDTPFHSIRIYDVKPGRVVTLAFWGGRTSTPAPVVVSCDPGPMG